MWPLPFAMHCFLVYTRKVLTAKRGAIDFPRVAVLTGSRETAHV